MNNKGISWLKLIGLAVVIYVIYFLAKKYGWI